VDQEEIDRVETQPLQARLRRALEIAGGEILGPHLGGDEHLVARHAARPEAGADRLLVVVHRGGVDVAIARFERRADRLGALLAGEPPRAEADGGNGGAIRLDEGFRHAILTRLGRSGPLNAAYRAGVRPQRSAPARWASAQRMPVARDGERSSRTGAARRCAGQHAPPAEVQQ
jgi:hypothetical protein